MRRAKEPWSRATCPLDSAFAEHYVALHVKRRFQVKLLVEVTVIADLMTLGHHSSHKIRPTLGVSSENEKGRFDIVLAQRVEYSRRRIGIRTIVERQRYLLVVRRKLAEHRPKHAAVAIEGAVCGAAQNTKSNGGRDDHTSALLRPSTAV